MLCSGERGPYSTSVSSVWLAMQESVVQMAGVQGVMSRLNYSVTALAFAMSGALAWQGQPQVWQSWARNYALLAWIHYSNAMCHPNIMNHPVAFDNIVRVSKLFTVRLPDFIQHSVIRIDLHFQTAKRLVRSENHGKVAGFKRKANWIGYHKCCSYLNSDEQQNIPGKESIQQMRTSPSLK
ncbi:hypothetical protein HAX54_004232 [Datura stramonium]|uniref:Uncharacterized protein n=1 Tax=Datura stramonium TaxID=4076 RepID=A0ABS8WSS0_DATST|nr:hypothetical protein [Datura stramonium]